VKNLRVDVGKRGRVSIEGPAADFTTGARKFSDGLCSEGPHIPNIYGGHGTAGIGYDGVVQQEARSAICLSVTRRPPAETILRQMTGKLHNCERMAD